MVGDPEKSEVCTIPVHVWNSGTLAPPGIEGQAGKTLGLDLVSAPELQASAAPFISVG